MNNLGLRMICMILGHEPMALNAMKSLGQWMTWRTLGHELRVVVDKNESQL